MRINITKKQYETLIKAVEAGDSVYGILGDEFPEEVYKKQSNEIEELQDYLLSFAKEFGFPEMTENYMDKMIMSDEYSEKFQEVIEDYDEITFWSELERRLGKRDFARTVTKEEEIYIEKHNGFLPERIHEIYAKWSDEFEEYGIDRLEVKKDLKK